MALGTREHKESQFIMGPGSTRRYREPVAPIEDSREVLNKYAIIIN